MYVWYALIVTTYMYLLTDKLFFRLAMLKATHIATQFSRYFVTWDTTHAVTSVVVVSTSSTSCSSSFSCRLALPPTTTGRCSRRPRSTGRCGATATAARRCIGRGAGTAPTIWRSSTTPGSTCPTSSSCDVAPASPTPVDGSRAAPAAGHAARRPTSSTFSHSSSSTKTTTMTTSSRCTRYRATSSWRRRTSNDRSTTAHPPGLIRHSAFTAFSRYLSYGNLHIRLSTTTAGSLSSCGIKTAFHDTDVDTDTDVLARILARMSVLVPMSVSWNAAFTRRSLHVLLLRRRLGSTILR